LSIFLYTITDPRTGKPFYVGITKKEKERKRSHIASKCKSTAATITEIRKDGQEPVFAMLGEFKLRQEAITAETALCRALHSAGIPLQNVNFRKGS